MLRLAGRPLSVVGRARTYVCGVTPYDVTHLGHAATFVWMDVVDRLLRQLGVQIEVCRNVTDIDDVLFLAAAKAGAPYDSYAALQQFHFDRDMEALGVRRPTHEPRARTFIPQVIALAEALLGADAAYVAGGSVYFRGAAALAKTDLTREQAVDLLASNGGRNDDPHKREVLDQAVWQASAQGEPAWPSPWGPGRPGWHAECTAMALATYGSSVDLHAGGSDLVFPHHAFEAAMAEAVSDVTPFARTWLHVGTVRLAGEKMAKSTGNLVFVADLLQRTSAAQVRMLLLDRPYDQAWDFTEQALTHAGERLTALRQAAQRQAAQGPELDAAAVDQVLTVLADDLNVAGAVDLALACGGQAARDLLAVLGLASAAAGPA